MTIILASISLGIVVAMNVCPNFKGSKSLGHLVKKFFIISKKKKIDMQNSKMSGNLLSRYLNVLLMYLTMQLFDENFFLH